MKQLNMRTGEIIEVSYDKNVVVVFEPNRPSYELRRLK